MNNLESLYTEALAEPSSTPQSSIPHTPINGNGSSRIDRCLAYLERMPDAISGAGGHDQTFAAACRIVEFVGDDPGAAWDLLQWWNTNKCSPPWSERELQHKLDDALRNTSINPDFQDRENRIPPTKQKRKEIHTSSSFQEKNDLASPGRLKTFLPLDAAMKFVEQCSEDGIPLIRRFAGDWFSFQRNHYQRLDKEAFEKRVWLFLERMGTDVTKRKVTDTLDAIRAVGEVLVENSDPPCWLDGTHGPDPLELLVVQNGILNVRDGDLFPSHPSLFSENISETEYRSGTECSGWEQFLIDVFDKDLEQIGLLQEWFGLVLTYRTSFQKMLMLVGPKRSGKGTIANILGSLVGESDQAALTVTKLADRFSFSTYADQKLAIISDARLGTKADLAALTEHLLIATGGDLCPIERKYHETIHRRVRARLMFLSNEIPTFLDVGGAIASRFLFLETKRSFENQADPFLLERLKAELPGILCWAINGYQRLMERGKFTCPESTRWMRKTVEDLASPLRTWVDECAMLHPDSRWECRAAYLSWKSFAEENGYPVGNEVMFGRNLRSSFPSIRKVRPRVGAGRTTFYEGLQARSDDGQ